jgi:hypothetical protein
MGVTFGPNLRGKTNRQVLEPLRGWWKELSEGSSKLYLNSFQGLVSVGLNLIWFFFQVPARKQKNSDSFTNLKLRSPKTAIQ